MDRLEHQQDEPAEVFPFGASVLPRGQPVEEARDMMVIGAYPSAVHVRWEPPTDSGLKPVQALAIDNEPHPFWNGSGEDRIVGEWVDQLGSDTYGSFKAAGRYNGSSGRWVDGNVLKPLAMDREDVWFTDCLDRYHSSDDQAARIADTYAEFARDRSLPIASVRSHPSEDEVVDEACANHLTRLRREVLVCQPEFIVTLGRAAARVMVELADEMDKDEEGNEGQLALETYGQMWSIRVGDHVAQWLPLAHPAAPKKWQEAHRTWIEERRTDAKKEGSAPPLWLPRQLLVNAAEIPDRLSSSAIKRLAGPASDYAQERSAMSAEKEVRAVVKAHRRLAKAEGGAAGLAMTATQITSVFGSAGTLTLPAMVSNLAVDLTTLAWIQCRMVLRIAALYGHDMDDHESRRQELLILWGMHSPTRQIGRYSGKASQRVAKRLAERYLKGAVLQALKSMFRVVGIKFSRAGVIRALPAINIPANAVVNDVSTKLLARKAVRYYRTLPSAPV